MIGLIKCIKHYILQHIQKCNLKAKVSSKYLMHYKMFQKEKGAENKIKSLY